MLSDKTWRLEVNSAKAEPRFLLAALRSARCRKYIEAAASGTEAHNISQAKLRSAPIWLPDVATQRQLIVQIQALDDAIAETVESERASETLTVATTHVLLKERR
jgi:restriction endonuclease S subunit